MQNPERFALNDNGTIYHMQDCPSAKFADKFVPLDKIPIDAKPCGRCKPPPAGNPAPAEDTFLESEPPDAYANPPAEAADSADEPHNEDANPPETLPKKSGKSVCMRGCAINGLWIPAGTIIESAFVKNSSHFREI